MGKGEKYVVILLLMMFSISFAYAVSPSGGDVSIISSSRATPDEPTSVQAQAGNVTQLNVNGVSTTQSWQGYFGNVTGKIILDDSAGNSLYNWDLASPEGEIYASTSNSVDWSAIQCFNFTADGSTADLTNDKPGETSLHGLNLEQLESLFGIDPDSVDGVDETFGLADENGYKHSLFYTNSLEFSAGECPSSHLLGNGGAKNDSSFEEVLLYDKTNDLPLFASLLDDSTLGFDGRNHDFEMLVLEDGHGTDTDTTEYFFYVELQ